mmetsp:Transcript_31570/g.73892  ORF Transcript_31570/g.73892 Transcript_31570/m.73892 type:complete len:213 (-) Transcript_31570:414-1052(-)
MPRRDSPQRPSANQGWDGVLAMHSHVPQERRRAVARGSGCSELNVPLGLDRVEHIVPGEHRGAAHPPEMHSNRDSSHRVSVPAHGPCCLEGPRDGAVRRKKPKRREGEASGGDPELVDGPLPERERPNDLVQGSSSIARSHLRQPLPPRRSQEGAWSDGSRDRHDELEEEDGPPDRERPPRWGEEAPVLLLGLAELHVEAAGYRGEGEEERK